MTAKKRRLKALTNQLRRLEIRTTNLQKAVNRFSWYRLTIFLVGATLGFATYWFNSYLSWGIFLTAITIFNVVAYFHRRLETSLKRHQIWMEIKQTEQARMNLDWQLIPRPAETHASPEHPYQVDLDLTGEQSLHQLLDISISHNGSDYLLHWLLQEEPDIETVQTRQNIIRELTPLSLFRDKLLLNFKLVSKDKLEGEKLLQWFQRVKSSTYLKQVLTVSSGLAALNWLLAILWGVGKISSHWLVISLIIYGLIYYFNHRLYTTIFDDATFLDTELKQTKTIFSYLEKFRYRSNQSLAKLCAPFIQLAQRPTRQLRKLTFIGFAIGLRMNYLMALLLNLIFPWDFFWAFQLNKAKLVFAKHFPEWLNICFELEALISLANFAYLNPEYTFPDLIPANTASENQAGQKIHLQAQQMGHPLIPPDQKICNDFSLEQLGQVVLITGSNMSGKSTFLRTLGINLCLAYAGAPVNAASFKTSIFRIFSCIKVNDSVTGGVSQFYAEVKRLKRLLVLLKNEKNFPLFFLIDEIFKGTNNRERLIGSRAYIRELLGQSGLGVVTTHDLELTKLVEELPDFSNFHFREEVIAGKMVFDYILHPGPCPTTNALKIMQLEGLPT